MITVAAFTGGRTSSPARFRVHQNIKPLKKHGVILDEFAAVWGSWPPSNALIRPFWGAGSLLSRLPAILSTRKYDITLLQRPMISKYVTLEGLTSSPRVLDVDDAIWLTMGETRARRLAELSDSIICGNTFLAEKFSRWNRSVTVIPTGVDTDRFCPPRSSARKDNIVIGWSGGSGGFPFLYKIESALTAVLRARTDVSLRIVANRRPQFQSLPDEKVEYIQWSPENEVRTIQGMDIGIMPMDGSVLSLGKCSYKMLLYMSCGKPVIVTPVGMNCEVLGHDKVGLQADSEEEWIESLLHLVGDQRMRQEMGKAGCNVVQEKYNIHLVAAMLADHFHSYY